MFASFAIRFNVWMTCFAPLNNPMPPSESCSPSQHRQTVTSATGSMAASRARLGALKVSNSSMKTARPAKNSASIRSAARCWRSPGSMALWASSPS